MAKYWEIERGYMTLIILPDDFDHLSHKMTSGILSHGGRSYVMMEHPSKGGVPIGFLIKLG